ncbi:apoptotic protease-activating factor 1 isoform X2 [Parasteatoda tepidariorum]|uniref:apoptotic protease-activating factor 1 isoform X2 n=1 Tax=Parasteatoda tepidariorum TaxID=114398 RepID=UPI001C71EAE0|nr:apoptotic protease-activating factor 1 isoform X2 [Parasteatoda tepidariorum]
MQDFSAADKQAFLNDLRPKYILSSLLIKRVITREETKEIMNAGETTAQVEKLFKILVEKTPDAMHEFIKVLKKDEDGCETYPWLAERLEVHFNQLTNVLNETLANGGVPFQVNYHLLRETKVVRVRTELKQAVIKAKLNENRHWIVMFGPVGSGKTVLAADALRNLKLLENEFPDGIFWIQVGYLDSEEEVKLKVKKMYKFLDAYPHIKQNDSYGNEHLAHESLLEDLRRKISKLPRILLILDDVRCSRIIRALDVGCPILVTTRHKNVVDDVSSYVTYINCQDDLEKTEIKELFSLHVKCKLEELPDVVDDICEKCNGSPMIANLIGSMMQDFKVKESFMELNKKLAESVNNAFRQRSTSRDKWDKNKNMITFCINELEKSLPDLKKYFLDFAIFYRDFPVPHSVLTLLWEGCMSPFEIEGFMNELYSMSLVQTEKGKNGDSYKIQSICLEALKDMCTEEEIIERHQIFVNKVMKKWVIDDTIDFSLLDDKDYIPYTISYHLYKAERCDLLEKVYFDLNFLEQKIRRLDPDYLFLDFQNYGEFFPNKDDIEMFKSFLHRYANEICSVESDIVQLALFEPNNSAVYQKAKIIAQKKGKPYYDWFNKEESKMNLFNFRRMQVEKLSHTTYNSNASLLAVVGDKALIISTETSEVVQELCGHSSTVNYCAFDHKNLKIVTASDDKTVKVFAINPIAGFQSKKRLSLKSSPSQENGIESPVDKSVYTFLSHDSRVLCCAFSNSDTHIISSDEGGLIFVWELLSSEARFILHYKHKISAASSCKFVAFSPDDSVFAATVGDTVHLYNFETGHLTKMLFHDGIFVQQFCFVGQEFLISAHDNTLSKWNLSSSERVEINDGWKRNDLIASCCVCANSILLACGTSSAEVIIIDLRYQKIVDFLLGHCDEVVSVSFSKDDSRLLTGSLNRYIIYDTSTIRNTPFTAFENNLSVRKMAEEIFIASSDYFNHVEVRKSEVNELVFQSDPEESDISACSISYDCSEIVYGMKNGHLKIINLATNASRSLSPSHLKQVNYILHSKTDLTFFSCSEDTTIKVWRNGSQSLILKGHTQSVTMCVAFKTADKLLSCSKDGSLRVWDTNSGQLCLPRIEGHGNQVITFCDISRDEKLLASACVDNTVKLWNSENGEHFKTLELSQPPQDHHVRCCRFSPNRDILISGHDNGDVIMWIFQDKVKHVSKQPHQSMIHDILFKEDGSQFLTISQFIKICDVASEDYQTLVLPSSVMGVKQPCIWASDDFNIIVAVVNYVLYILKKI